ncbi:hypothetical protein M1P56_14130 [Streptomyces sp. HU2014]|uniref:Uncharacterized protein n=1 Tax=Streptomyces albireticuli TaxID=1940 RepID=A0A1Z2LCK5_9ACTN|nr:MULTISPECIES: hypothetical protein [Streptomyces]ARZ72012.1 hypothetical protein SMD11_6436 [Streptomyces albireticuli]UQI45405.1 hypothetical protein M1P56_14130 [Streptomyces sp. HU2014]
MSVFAEAMRQRVRDARAALALARAEGDAYGTAVAADELDDALRTALRHGVDPDAPESPDGGEASAGRA